MQAETGFDALAIHRLVELDLNRRIKHRREVAVSFGTTSLIIGAAVVNDHENGCSSAEPSTAVRLPLDRDAVLRPALQRRIRMEDVDRGIQPFAFALHGRREGQRLRQRARVFGNRQRHDRAIEDHGDRRVGSTPVPLSAGSTCETFSELVAAASGVACCAFGCAVITLTLRSSSAVRLNKASYSTHF